MLSYVTARTGILTKGCKFESYLRSQFTQQVTGTDLVSVSHLLTHIFTVHRHSGSFFQPDDCRRQLRSILSLVRTLKTPMFGTVQAFLY